MAATRCSAVIILHDEEEQARPVISRPKITRSLTIDSSLASQPRSSLPSTCRRASLDHASQKDIMEIAGPSSETYISSSSTQSSQCGSSMLLPLPQYSFETSLHLTPPASPSPFMTTFKACELPPTQSSRTSLTDRWLPSISKSDSIAAGGRQQQQRRFKRFLYLVIIPTAAVLLLAATAASLTPSSKLPFFITRQKIQGEYVWRKRALLEERQNTESSEVPVLSVADGLTGSDSTPTPTSTGSSPSSSNPSSNTSTGSSSATTTVAPPVAATPVLPTPFPQPFDSTLSTDFATGTCQIFFANLTSNISFRQCRPLSLLLPSSNAFLQAQLQGNLTLVNAILYGTCNTTPTEDECVGRMQGWETEIRQSCATELDQGHTLSWMALNGFRNYKMVRDVGCLRNLRSDTFCYVDSLVASPPADIYLYQLPLGTPLPGSSSSSSANSAQSTSAADGGGSGVNVKPSCSSCSQSVMNIYAQYAGNSSLLISQTYPGAQRAVEAACGSGYASAVNAAVGNIPSKSGIQLVFMTFLLLFVGFLW
ncbi:hypothetical protein FRC14_007555 [Serendipita sp. 396]|nr:hypothetical protein FRC14_007555 [Serendipita sp. 396]KAG8785010.1 hypothetical protein FRC15_002172 [Serendipita sp. 397]KAG8800697.1 hypothetical protein FRC16_002261 [Serendipita sp. 398]